MAETYHVLDYKGLRPSLVEALIVGLGENSRLKRRINEVNVSQDTLLLASIVDRLGTLISWLGNIDPPESIVDKLLGYEEESDVKSYDSVQDFINARYGGN